MNILIVGFGKMGKSHFRSFVNSKKKYQIFLYDKKFNKKKKYSYNKKEITEFNTFPKNKKFDLVIISTNANVRLKILTQLVKNNKFKFLLLEKFLFLKLNDYKIATKIISKYHLKVFVNVWGKIIFKPLKNKLKNKLIKKITIICKKGELLTNLIHYYDFLSSAINSSSTNLIINKNYKLIKAKRKSYQELDAELINNAIPLIKINTKEKIKYHLFNIETEKNQFSIKINYSGICYYYLNNKLFKKTTFPYAYLTTEKYFLHDYNSTKLKYFLNVNQVFSLSLEILRILKKYVKQKVIFT